MRDIKGELARYRGGHDATLNCQGSLSW